MIVALEILAIVTVIVGLLAWAHLSIRKQVLKDLQTLYDLEERAQKLTTLEEVAEFHLEFVEKANKMHNSEIRSRLDRVDAYLRGQYKVLKQKQ